MCKNIRRAACLADRAPKERTNIAGGGLRSRAAMSRTRQAAAFIKPTVGPARRLSSTKTKRPSYFAACATGRNGIFDLPSFTFWDHTPSGMVGQSRLENKLSLFIIKPPMAHPLFHNKVSLYHKPLRSAHGLIIKRFILCIFRLYSCAG